MDCYEMRKVLRILVTHVPSDLFRNPPFSFVEMRTMLNC
jgi:hypothetical protein